MLHFWLSWTLQFWTTFCCSRCHVPRIEGQHPDSFCLDNLAKRAWSHNLSENQLVFPPLPIGTILTWRLVNLLHDGTVSINLERIIASATLQKRSEQSSFSRIVLLYIFCLPVSERMDELCLQGSPFSSELGCFLSLRVLYLLENTYTRRVNCMQKAVIREPLLCFSSDMMELKPCNITDIVIAHSWNPRRDWVCSPKTIPESSASTRKTKELAF